MPMTEKVCQLYEEEQISKTREGRKAVPTDKMPDLGWDIAEAQLPQENQENNNPHITFPLQALITIIIMLITSLQLITAYAKKTSKLAKKTVQAVKSTITKASRNELLQNIKNFYRTTILVITLATNNNSPTNCNGQIHAVKENTQNYPGTRKLNDEYDYSYQSHTCRTHNNKGN